jgi:hypothetical protein
MNWPHLSLLSLGCAFGVTSPSPAALTALRALKIARRRLRPEVRDKLVSICSAPTDSTFEPDAWRFVFSDDATRRHYRSVIVAAKASSESRGVLEAFKTSKTGSATPLHPISINSVVLDSDGALAQVRSVSKLRGHFSAVYRLFISKKEQEPLWHLSFYTEALNPVISYRVRTKGGTILPIEQGIYDS